MSEPLETDRVRAAAELDMRLSENITDVDHMRRSVAGMAGRVAGLTYMIDKLRDDLAESERLRAELAKPDPSGEQSVAEALRQVDRRLAALDFRWFGGLPFVEREFIFAAVNDVAKELFGGRWVAAMRGEDLSQGSAGTGEVRRGGCPVCTLSSLPVVDGVLEDHTTPAGVPAGLCAGSGRTPR